MRLKSIKIGKISASVQHSLVLTDDGFVYSFGSNSIGQLGQGDKERRLLVPTQINVSHIIHVNAGYENSILIELWSCWNRSREDPNVCSGNGICWGMNNCTCNVFRGIGKDCEFRFYPLFCIQVILCVIGVIYACLWLASDTRLLCSKFQQKPLYSKYKEWAMNFKKDKDRDQEEQSLIQEMKTTKHDYL
jgi:hypothetical protein